MDYNVIKSHWYGNIGIIAVKPDIGPVKFYIGSGEGKNQEDDEQYIAAWGNPVYPEVVSEFFKID